MTPGVRKYRTLNIELNGDDDGEANGNGNGDTMAIQWPLGNGKYSTLKYSLSETLYYSTVERKLFITMIGLTCWELRLVYILYS